jgi:hypothetical protein
MNRFRHLILTRFNVRIEQYQWPPLDWLEHRFALFERFCYPSVRGQTNTNFDWLVFCHPEMPPAIQQRIRVCCEWSAFRPVYFRSVFSQAMVQATISDLVQGFTHIITTRLDNDDAISRTFVETIQQQFTGQEFEFLNFTNGYIWRKGHLYRGENRSNPFISLVERAEDYSTVYCGNHVELDQTGPIVQIREPAGWLQVVHGRNLLNDVVGGPAEVHDIPESFAIADESLRWDPIETVPFASSDANRNPRSSTRLA